MTALNPVLDQSCGASNMLWLTPGLWPPPLSWLVIFHHNSFSAKTSVYTPYGSKGSGGGERGQRKSSVIFVLTLIHQAPTIFLIKEMPKMHFPPHSRLLQRGTSDAFQNMPSPLLCQLLSFSTIQNMHLQNNQSCDLLLATDSSLIFNRGFQKLEV